MQRIEKIDPSTLSGEPKRIFERWSPGGQPLNIVLIYFRNLNLNRNWSYMATHLFMKNSLSDRQREIIVLRVSWQCASDYEFIQHVRIVREQALMTEDEIKDLLQQEPVGDWTPAERTLIALSDELLALNSVTDPTWCELTAHFDVKQQLDAIATAGGYTLNSMATNSFDVDIEDTMQRESGLVPSWHAPAFRFMDREDYDAANSRAPDGKPPADEKAEGITRPFLDRSERVGLLSVIAHHPLLVRDWLPIIRHVDTESTLDRETRLIVAIRTAYRCNCSAELADRKAIAVNAGVQADDINRALSSVPESACVDRLGLLVRATDELIDNMLVSDSTWTLLKEFYSDEQVMDIVFAVATGLMVSWMQNALGVSAEVHA
ncbi:MAG: carboxymuconolactone decarboxylase family protein [Pseudomonadota bacterium]